MMNRIKIYSILLCILCLLPVLTQAQTLTQYEYWFDDDFANRQAVSLSGANATIDVDIDASSLGTGLHRFHLRFQQSDGMYSAVTSNYFFKAQMSEGGILEYWFDDNKDASKKITGQLASDGKDYVFNTLLDVTDISMGSHRFYYRVVNTDGTTCSPVSMTPVMLHSRYNVKAEDLKVTKYSITVDDEEPLILDVPSPKEATTIPYTLDARRFSVGDHTLTAQFWNSIGIPVSEQATFKVLEQETPAITLSAREKDGYVTLAFNSIPNDVHYIVGRKDENGNARKVFETYNSKYPNNISVVDHPVAGNYTYYVRAVYTDKDENQHGVSSNEIPLTIDSYSAENPKGCIVGRVIFGEKEIDLISAIRNIYVEFSDGGEKVQIEPNGTFYRDGIDLGTKLTLSIPDDDYYTYEKVEVEVTENTRNEVQIIKATWREDNTVQISNTSHDLVITSLRVKDSPNGFDIQVQNISGHTWRGHIKLIAVRTEDLEKEKSSPKSVFQLSAFKSYYDAGSTYINYLPNGEVQPVNIKITGIPVSEDGDTYSFFIISNENGEENILKLLDCSNTISITNPLKQWIKGDEEFNYYGLRNELMLKEGVAEILSMMKKMDKGVGPFTFALNEIEDGLRQYEIDHDLDGFFGNLPDILQYVSVDIKNAIDDVKVVTDLIGDAKKFFDYIETFEILNGDDYTKKFTTFSTAVMNYAMDGNPIAGIFAKYLETPQHAYETANSWSKHFNDITLGRKFDDHEVSIIVEVDGSMGNFLNSFSAKDVQEKIVKAELHMRQDQNWSHRVYTPIVSGTDVFLKFAYDMPSNHQEFLVNVPIDEFYMEVFWEGDLMTPVWLLDDTKVKYDLGTYRVKFKSTAVWAHNMLEGLHWQPKDE